MCNDAAKWYGPPIALQGVPGNVFATKDGDFIGECRAGWEASAFDRAHDVARRLRRAARIASGPRRALFNAGFASLSDLISEATAGGKRQQFLFQKVGPTAVVNNTSTLWRVGNQPIGGAAGSAAASGRACVGSPIASATAGAIPYTAPAGGDTLHFVSANLIASTSSQTLLLYDRLFDVAKTMSSSGTEAVSGVPTRYQSVSTSNAEYAAGNFLFIEIFAALSGTAHNWTTCLYTDQGGAASTLPSVTGISSGAIDRLDQPAGTWFCPLASGDTGIQTLTQMQCSSNVVTGSINFVIGRPIAWLPCPLANTLATVDGINTAFNLTRIIDTAALALLQVCAPVTTATTFTGDILTCAG